MTALTSCLKVQLRGPLRSASCATSAFLAVLLVSVFAGGAAADNAAAERTPAPAGTSLSLWPFSDALAHHEPLERIAGAGTGTHCNGAPASDSRFDEAIAYSEKLGGYSLLIWSGGRCELAYYHNGFDKNLRAESASMHKTVVALLLLAAIDDGHIDSVDDPIGRYLPQWRDDTRGAITLRQVLTMSSGLEPFSREGGLQSPGFAYVMSTRDPRGDTLGRPPQHAPGTHFHYAGFNTQLLLLAIEAATDKRYSDYLQERLWSPLGNGEADLWLYPGEQRMPRAYSALMARASDWLRVGLLLKDRGQWGDEQLVSAELVREMTSPSATNPNYGWQVWMGTEYEPVRYYTESQEGIGMAAAEPFAADDMIYLDGIGGQRVYVSRLLDLVIVRQGDARSDWDDTRLPNLVIQALADGSE